MCHPAVNSSLAQSLRLRGPLFDLWREALYHRLTQAH